MNQIKTVLLALARKWKYRKFKHVASSAWIANNASIVSCIHNHTTENWTKNIQNDKRRNNRMRLRRRSPEGLVGA